MLDISSSISYRRFIREMFETFRNQHFNDIIDHLEKNENHTLKSYLVEAEVQYEVWNNFRHNIVMIAKDLGLDLLETMKLEKDKQILKRVYSDFIEYLAPKLKAEIKETAYFELAHQIKGMEK